MLYIQGGRCSWSGLQVMQHHQDNCIIRRLRKLLPPAGVVWALRAQSWKKSPKMSSQGLSAPRTHFRTLIPSLGPKGPNDSCSRARQSQFEDPKIQPKVFLTEAFGNPLGSWTSAPSGHGCPRQNVCLSRVSRALTQVLAWDIRMDDPRMSAGYPSRKLPLWVTFSFLRRPWFPYNGLNFWNKRRNQ